jgi:hypothetical protein
MSELPLPRTVLSSTGSVAVVVGSVAAVAAAERQPVSELVGDERRAKRKD